MAHYMSPVPSCMYYNQGSYIELGLSVTLAVLLRPQTEIEHENTISVCRVIPDTRRSNLAKRELKHRRP